MPPSGFTEKHSRGISSFLTSCLADLIREGKEKKINPDTALVNEIANIIRDLGETRRSDSSTAILKLILAFYIDCRKKHPENWQELARHGQNMSDLITREMEAIKVRESVSV